MSIKYPYILYYFILLFLHEYMKQNMHIYANTDLTSVLKCSLQNIVYANYISGLCKRHNFLSNSFYDILKK